MADVTTTLQVPVVLNGSGSVTIDLTQLATALAPIIAPMLQANTTITVPGPPTGAAAS